MPTIHTKFSASSRILSANYNFGGNGGAVGVYTFDQLVLPFNAIPVLCTFNTLISPTSATSNATISFGWQGNNEGFKPATNVTEFSPDNLCTTNFSNALAAYVNGAGVKITMEIGTEPLTAGIIVLFCQYYFYN